MKPYNKEKNKRKLVAENNIERTKGLYVECKDKIYDSIVKSVKYNDVRQLKIAGVENKSPTIVDVVYADTAETGFRLQKDGYNPVILNMASERHPGGGWKNGSMAQEESLFYRSLYYLSLEDPWKLNPSSSTFYPMEPYAGIYSPNVLFFRNINFELLGKNEYKFISCIALPAIRNPVLVAGKYSDCDKSIMLEKMEGIVKIALLHKHDSIVLGAMGAGAFHNPPHEVAKLFKIVIKKYQNYFKKITFAIIDNAATDNFNVFSKVFQE